MPREWLYRQPGGSDEGPVTSRQLRQLVKEGRVLPDTLVFTNEIGRWVEAKRIARLFAEAPAVLRSGAAGVGGDRVTGAPATQQSHALPDSKALSASSDAMREVSGSSREAGAETERDIAQRKNRLGLLIMSIIAVAILVGGMKEVGAILESTTTSNARPVDYSNR